MFFAMCKNPQTFPYLNRAAAAAIHTQRLVPLLAIGTNRCGYTIHLIKLDEREPENSPLKDSRSAWSDARKP